MRGVNFKVTSSRQPRGKCGVNRHITHSSAINQEAKTTRLLGVDLLEVDTASLCRCLCLALHERYTWRERQQVGYAAGYGRGLRIGRVREGNCKECDQGGGGDNGRKRVKKGHAVVWCAERN